MDKKTKSTNESIVPSADKNNLTTTEVLSKRRVGNYIYQLVAIPQGSVTNSQSTNDTGGTGPTSEVLDETLGSHETSTDRQSCAPKFKIPAHILGRNLGSLELEGKRKPRPGVRVPNLTLTSQILSKEELYREVAQRGTRAQQQDPKSDPLLPKKITECLASKLGTGTESASVGNSSSSCSPDSEEPTDARPEVSTALTQLSTTSKRSLLELMRKEYAAGLNSAVSEELRSPDIQPSSNADLGDMDVEAAIAALHGEPLIVEERENGTISGKVIGDKAETEPSEKQRKGSRKGRNGGSQESAEINPTRMPTAKKNKRTSAELNRLFIDEGAINMLREMERSGRASRRSGSGEVLQSLIPKELLAKKTLKTIKRTPDVQKRKSALSKKRKTPRILPKTIGPNAQLPDDKASSQWEAFKTTLSENPDEGGVVFVTRKVHNPAEASQIIRRRSCSWSSDEDLEGHEASKKLARTPAKQRNGALDANQELHQHELGRSQDHEALNLKEVQLKYMDGYAHVILSQRSSATLQNALSVEVLLELQQIFEALNKNDAISVVLLTSVGPAFCHGVDVSTLLAQSQEEIHGNAKRAAEALTKFLKELNRFDKILIAGINGCAVGVGVAMLPFFDMVYASEKATFSLPYARLGQTTEGAVAATFAQLGSKRLASSLLYEGRRLTAMEAERFGLVSAILWPSRFHEDLIPRVKQIASQSITAMLAMKAAQNEAIRPTIDSLLEKESELLVKSWTSPDFQTRVRAYLDNFDDNL